MNNQSINENLKFYLGQRVKFNPGPRHPMYSFHDIYVTIFGIRPNPGGEDEGKIYYIAVDGYADKCFFAKETELEEIALPFSKYHVGDKVIILATSSYGPIYNFQFRNAEIIGRLNELYRVRLLDDLAGMEIFVSEEDISRYIEPSRFNIGDKVYIASSDPNLFDYNDREGTISNLYRIRDDTSMKYGVKLSYDMEIFVDEDDINPISKSDIEDF